MSDVFGASSQNRNRLNPDGTRSVFCSTCGDFIGVSMEYIGRATCFLCQRIEEGKPLDEEALRTYKLAKANRVDVGALALPDETDMRAVGIKKKFNITDLAGNVLRAVGRFAATESTQPEPSTLKSVQVAKSKRRPRLFEGVVLGSMQEIDKKAGKE